MGASFFCRSSLLTSYVAKSTLLGSTGQKTDITTMPIAEDAAYAGLLSLMELTGA